jgi:hypothetical protein
MLKDISKDDKLQGILLTKIDLASAQTLCPGFGRLGVWMIPMVHGCKNVSAVLAVLLSV